MTTERRNIIVLGVGLIVAVMGLLPIITIVGSGPTTADEEAPPADAVPAANSGQLEADRSPDGSPGYVLAETAPIVQHTQETPPDITGLSNTISRVLTAKGFAEEVDPAAIEEEIPSSVARLLAARGVAISVAEAGDDEQ